MNGENLRSRSGGYTAVEAGTRPDAIPVTEIDITKDRLSDVLQNRRQQLGLKIEEVSEDIKIRPDYLRAIEAEAFDRLPTVEYGRLFLKSYAERLGLNVSEIYALYDLHHRPAFDTTPKTKPAGEAGTVAGPTPRMTLAKPQPPKIWMYVLFGIVIVAVLIAIAMKLVGDSDSATPTDEVSRTQSRANVVETPPATVQSSPQVAVNPDPSAGVQAGEPVDAQMRLTLNVRNETWMRLLADADTIRSGIVRAGQTVSATALDRFVLSLGHTNGVEASVGGRQLRPFSNWTQSLSGLVITADSVSAWMIPSAQPVSNPIQ